MTTTALRHWTDTLNSTVLAQQKAFFEVRIKHPKLEMVIDSLLPLLTPHSESNIIFIVGAPGVGKSTLSRTALQQLYTNRSEVIEGDPSAIPIVAVEAYANGENRHGFRGLYESFLAELMEPGIDRKSAVVIANGIMQLKGASRMTVARLRKILEEALRQRHTEVCVIDEAYHLLRFGEDSAVMDTLKSLANTTGTKFVLVGSYDLFDLVEHHAQAARRSTLIHFDRYKKDNADDRAAFRRIVSALQAKWPCKVIPNLAAVSDDLLDLSFGCVGLLKSFMLDVSAMQLRNKGGWKSDFVKRAAKSNALRNIIRNDIKLGEDKVRDALCGESMWNEDLYQKLLLRMGNNDA